MKTRDRERAVESTHASNGVSEMEGLITGAGEGPSYGRRPGKESERIRVGRVGEGPSGASATGLYRWKSSPGSALGK